MPDIDPNKTVFISYRRSVHPHLSLMLFKDLRRKGFDPFRDSDTMGAGEFEKIILNQIQARTHFLVLLSYGTLDRCVEEGDWLRREIELAIDSGRNIVPVIVDGFKFSDGEKYLTGKLSRLSDFQAQPLYTEEAELYEVGLKKLINQKLKPPVYSPVLKPAPSTDELKVDQIIEEDLNAPVPTQEELNSEQWFTQAVSKQMRFEWDSAINDLNKAIALNSEYVVAYMSRSICFASKGDFDNALADADEVIRLSPLDPHSYDNRAKVLFVKNDLDSALVEVNKALDIKSDFGVAYFTRHEIRKQLGDEEGAKTDYNKAIALIGNDLAKITVQLGMMNATTPDQAIIYYNKAIEYDVTYDLAYKMRSQARDKKGDTEGAIEDLTKALSLQPKDYISYSNRGVLYEQKNLTDAAMADYNEAIRLNPNYPIAYINRGAASIKKGDIKAGITDCTRAIHIDKNIAQAYANRGSGYFKRGNINKAIKEYSTAINLKTTDGKIYYDRGLFYYLIDELEKAFIDFDSAVEFTPELADGYVGRAVILFLNKQYDKAIIQYQKANDLKPIYKYVIAGLALTNHSLGKTGEAKRLWRELVAQDERYKDADWVGKEFQWKEPMIEAARKLIAELE